MVSITEKGKFYNLKFRLGFNQGLVFDVLEAAEILS